MKKIILMLLLIFWISAGVFVSPALAEEHAQSAYDKVIKSGVIHCGYGVWAPNMIKDPNTGALSGFFYDYMNALAASASLKVEWSEESWSDYPAALKAGRIDAMCAGIWPTASKAREMDFTIPINYVAVHTYVRADDSRFDNALEKLNSPEVTVSTMDGEISIFIAQSDFPQAKLLSLPNTASQPQIMLNVVEGKADVAFADASTGNDFMANDPGKLKLLPGGEFLRVFGNTVAVGEGEYALKELLDTGTQEMLFSGAIEKTLKKYEKYPNSLYRVGKPYSTVPE